LKDVRQGEGGQGSRGRSTGLPLHKIALNARTDKALYHQYTLFYETWLSHWRRQEFDMLEIGVYREESLQMWKRYFPKANVFGADAYPDKRWRNAIVLADQERPGDLRNLAAMRNWSIIVDDGSHAPRHQFNTFATLFPVLQPGGVYIVEDIETQWWRTLPYGVKRRRGDPNLFELFRRASRDILQRDFMCEQQSPIFSPVIDHAIGSISFISNAIIVTKKPAAYTRDRVAYRDRDKLDCRYRFDAWNPWVLSAGVIALIISMGGCRWLATRTQADT
jgi:hypothetical protein